MNQILQQKASGGCGEDKADYTILQVFGLPCLAVFWVLTLCMIVVDADISDEHDAFIFTTTLCGAKT